MLMNMAANMPSGSATPRRRWIARDARFGIIELRAGRRFERDVHLFGDQHQLGAIDSGNSDRYFGRGRIGETDRHRRLAFFATLCAATVAVVSAKFFERLSIFRPVAGADPRKRATARADRNRSAAPTPRRNPRTNLRSMMNRSDNRATRGRRRGD